MKTLLAFCLAFTFLFASEEKIELLSDEDKLANTAASQGYDERFADLVELVYGQDFLSQGGKDSVVQMMEGIDLAGRKILDIGAGLGGPALCLAEKYPVEVVAIDPQSWLIDRANNRLEAVKKNLKGTVHFCHTENPATLKQFPDASFDVVFSKESILHIPLEIKESFFKEIYRVLKPGGEIVIMDWMHASPNYSENTKKMMAIDEVAYNLITPSEYENILKRAGFVSISMRNTTLENALFSQESIEIYKNLKGAIESIVGEEVYALFLTSWEYQRDAFQSEELLTGIFKAKKGSPKQVMLEQCEAQVSKMQGAAESGLCEADDPTAGRRCSTTQQIASLSEQGSALHVEDYPKKP